MLTMRAAGDFTEQGEHCLSDGDDTEYVRLEDRVHLVERSDA